MSGKVQHTAVARQFLNGLPLMGGTAGLARRGSASWKPAVGSAPRRSSSIGVDDHIR